jgi:hypothetical protein
VTVAKALPVSSASGVGSRSPVLARGTLTPAARLAQHPGVAPLKSGAYRKNEPASRIGLAPRVGSVSKGQDHIGAEREPECMAGVCECVVRQGRKVYQQTKRFPRAAHSPLQPTPRTAATRAFAAPPPPPSRLLRPWRPPRASSCHHIIVRASQARAHSRAHGQGGCYPLAVHWVGLPPS